MSKFRNRIRDIGRASGGFGFAALAQREDRRYMLVVATVTSADEAEAAANAGADALILDSTSHLADVAERVRLPVGVRMEAATGVEVTAAREAGADFFVFDDGRAHASALTDRDMGRVLILGPDQQEDRLRAVAGIDLDALIVEVAPGIVTVRDQIELRRVASLTGATLMVSCTEDVPDAGALEAWRDAGAALVLVPGAEVERALAAAAAVPAPARQSRGNDVPLLGQPSHTHDHDDDEDD